MPLLDRWLVRRACAGETRAFEKLYARHVSRIYNLLRRLTGGDEATAEDLAQETFLAAYRSLTAWRGEGALSTWLCGIAVRLYRQHCRADRSTEELSETLPAENDSSDPLAHCHRNQVLRHLETGIAALPDLYREAFVLAYVEGFAYKEVAMLLSVPVGTVQSRLNTAKKLLRLHLTPLLTDSEPASPAPSQPAKLPASSKKADSHVL